MIRKVLLTTLVLFVTVLVSGCGGQEVQVSESEEKNQGFQEEQEVNTDDWQTYRNEEWGFEMKVPSDWIKDWTFNEVHREVVKRETDLVVTFVSGDVEERRENKQLDHGYMYDLSIRIWETFSDNPNVGSSNIINTPEEFFEKVNTAQRTSEFEVDGNKAYEYIQGGHGAADAILIKANDRYYSFMFDRPSYKGAKEIREYIISTIKFF